MFHHVCHEFDAGVDTRNEASVDTSTLVLEDEGNRRVVPLREVRNFDARAVL